jgi:hypothetical protein
MGNVIDLAKWKQQTGGPDGIRAAGSRDHLRPRTYGGAAGSTALWRDIRRTGTSLAEDFRVFVYAGELSGHPGDVSRDMNTLKAAFDLLECRAGREGGTGANGFHVLLGNGGRSEWVNDRRYGRVLALTANFTAAEAARLIEERLQA